MYKTKNQEDAPLLMLHASLFLREKKLFQRNKLARIISIVLRIL